MLCPNCGKPNPEKVKFCFNCGNKFEVTPTDNKSAKELLPKKPKKHNYGKLAFIFIVFGGLSASQTHGGSSTVEAITIVILQFGLSLTGLLFFVLWLIDVFKRPKKVEDKTK